jgi:uncharacterized protein YdeI (YjbR/CyaY-like superfamily)
LIKHFASAGLTGFAKVSTRSVQAQIPSYRKAVSWWVVSAKKEETRQRRLDKLIEDSAQGRTIEQYTRLQKSK